MTWTIVSTPPTWNVTDVELLNRLIYFTLENGNADAALTLQTPMYSFQQYIDALNLAQEKFLRDTGCILTRATQATTPQVGRYALPSDWIFTRRLTWQAQAAGSPIKSLARTDSYELDHELLDWQQNFDVPVAYNDGSDLPTLTLEIAKAPAGIGSMELDYVAQPVALTGTIGGPAVGLTVPDECESAVLYLALFHLFSSDGEGHDADRAEYCLARYELAVQLTNSLTGGADQPQAQAGG